MKIKSYESSKPISSEAYIGIDPSLTGFAVCALDAHDQYSIRVFTPRTRGAERLLEIKDQLALFLAYYNILDVAMEGTVVHSNSASVLGEISGVVKEYLFREHSTAPMNVPPMSLKKFVCGQASGVSKSQIMMSLLKRYDVELPDDNAADAYGIARIVRGVATNTVETDVIMKLQDPKYRV